MISFLELITEKIPKDVYNSILQNNRVIIKRDNKLELKNYNKQYISNKPNGLGYAIGREGIDGVRKEMPSGEEDFVFTIDINLSKILVIKTASDRIKFEQEYGLFNSKFKSYSDINGKLVSKKYSGIELLAHGGGNVANGNKSGDVKSGCIWDKSAIKKVIKKG